MRKKRSRGLGELARQERFVYKTNDGETLDVTHLFRKRRVPYLKLLTMTLFWAFVGFYIVALIKDC